MIPVLRRAALLLPLLLSACATEVAQAPASLLIPDAWRQQVGPQSPVEAEWWRAFHDPHLNRLVSQALRRNDDVLIARARVDEYRARLRAARGANVPQVDAGINVSRTRALSAITGLPGERDLFQGVLQADYDVDLWGARRNTVSAAGASLAAQRAAADAASLTVASSVAAGYFSLLSLDAQLRVTRDTLQVREQSLRLARRQYEAGYSSRLEWMQAASELQTARAQIPPLQQQIARQENALSLLTGMNPRQIGRADEFAVVTPHTLPALLPSSLLQRRPDIAQAERLLLAADASLAASRARLLPSLTLTASGTLQGSTLNQLLSDPFRLWSIGGSVLAPLLNREALTAQVDVDQALRNQALYGYEQVVRQAFSEVNNDLEAIARGREQVAELDTQQRIAAETLRIARNRYQNGYSAYLDELDAQRTLFSAQLSLVQAKSNLLLAQVDLYRALGGGWQPPR
ncbi:efflux transporter outer membrane subunit [Pantoea sp. 1.19]|uniref:efflux transporter outer membrane subunit n=1 Tax=Pantoea sp. 1.19 TaxID=1925589 RepID=UPI000AA268EE|nr:efflux transporter outer membrane subunit [Pantoea sp. 1.19]